MINGDNEGLMVQENVRIPKLQRRFPKVAEGNSPIMHLGLVLL